MARILARLYYLNRQGKDLPRGSLAILEAYAQRLRARSRSRPSTRWRSPNTTKDRCGALDHRRPERFPGPPRCWPASPCVPTPFGSSSCSSIRPTSRTRGTITQMGFVYRNPSRGLLHERCTHLPSRAVSERSAAVPRWRSRTSSSRTASAPRRRPLGAPAGAAGGRRRDGASVQNWKARPELPAAGPEGAGPDERTLPLGRRSGVIEGSGLLRDGGVSGVEEVRLLTPHGEPSGPLSRGTDGG